MPPLPARRHGEGWLDSRRAVAEAASRAGEAASDLRSALAELARQAEGLRGKVDLFPGAIRAA